MFSDLCLLWYLSWFLGWGLGGRGRKEDGEKKGGRKEQRGRRKREGGRQTDRLETEALLPGEPTRSRSEHPLYGLRHSISNIPIPQGIPGLG